MQSSKIVLKNRLFAQIFAKKTEMRRKKGRVIENIAILRIASEGKTIAKTPEGQVIFTERCVPGDVVDLQITRKRKKMLHAIPIRFHRYSELRRTPFCDHFGTCGGCKWQNLDYEQQLSYKQQQVTDHFERIAKVEFPAVKPILAAPKTQYYRNKLDFTFSNKRWISGEEIDSGEKISARNALGFHIPRRYDKILDIEHCYLQPEPSNKIRGAVRDFALKRHYTFYDINENTGFLRNLIIRTSQTGDLMVILQVAEPDLEKIDAMLRHLKNTFPEITSLQYIINQKLNETFHDLEVHTFDGLPYIFEEMEGLKFRIGAKSFYQTNPEQAYELYKITRNLAELSGSEIVYDLYTGTGTIANFIARKAKKVVGIEYVAQAIEDAKINSKINNIENTSFFAGDMKDVLTPEFMIQNGTPDVIITDPPRAGMHPDVIRRILEMNAKKIVYVSCNPATQARDLGMLDSKYAVMAVQPVDMFPQTFHVENVVLLERKAI